MPDLFDASRDFSGVFPIRADAEPAEQSNSLFDLFGASFSNMRNTQNADSLDRTIGKELGLFEDRYRKITGKTVEGDNPLKFSNSTDILREDALATSRGIGVTPQQRPSEELITDRLSIWEEQAVKWNSENPDNPVPIPSNLINFRIQDIERVDAKQAALIKEKGGFGAVIGFLGGVAGTLTDPINLAAAAIPTFGGAQTLGRLAISEAVIGGVTEGATLPSSSILQEFRDAPLTFQDILFRVGTGVVAGGLIPVGVAGSLKVGRGAVDLTSAAASKIQKRFDAFRQNSIKETGIDPAVTSTALNKIISNPASPSRLKDSLKFVRRAIHIEEGTPFKKPGDSRPSSLDAQHLESTAQAEKKLFRSQPVLDEDLALSHSEFHSRVQDPDFTSPRDTALQAASRLDDIDIPKIRLDDVTTADIDAVRFGAPGVRGSRPSLSRFIINEGGIRADADILSELADLRKGLTKVREGKGIDIENLIDRAVREGYFDGRPTRSQFIESVKGDVVGSGQVFPAAIRDEIEVKRVGRRKQVDDVELLEREIRESGIRLEELSNEEVVKQLKGDRLNRIAQAPQEVVVESLSLLEGRASRLEALGQDVGSLREDIASIKNKQVTKQRDIEAINERNEVNRAHPDVEKEMEELGLIEKEPMEVTELERLLDELDTPTSASLEIRDSLTFLDENADLKVQLDDRVVTVRELQKEFADDDALITAMKTCSTGA